MLLIQEAGTEDGGRTYSVSSILRTPFVTHFLLRQVTAENFNLAQIDYTLFSLINTGILNGM